MEPKETGSVVGCTYEKGLERWSIGMSRRGPRGGDIFRGPKKMRKGLRSSFLVRRRQETVSKQERCVSRK